MPHMGEPHAALVGAGVAAVGGDEAARYVAVPALASGGGALLRWRGHFMWARAGTGTPQQQQESYEYAYTAQSWSPWSARKQ